jgi:hypothetical protein
LKNKGISTFTAASRRRRLTAPMNNRVMKANVIKVLLRLPWSED